MKKYLMTGIAALAITAAFTSCSHNDDIEVYTQEQIDKAKYDQAFLNYVGGSIAEGQDWGFSASIAGSRMTRAAGDPEVVKKDMWVNDPSKLNGATVPADVTTAEAAYVYEWFQKEENKGLTESGKDWSNFFIQQVYGTMDQQKQGIWHRFDQNRINNGYSSNYYDEEFSDKGGMDYLTVGDGQNMTHVLDFNAEKGGPWNIVYMKNSSALKFGYHGSWDSSDRQLFKLAEIEVPGTCFSDGVARKGWYVGLSLLAEKYDNGQKILGEQRKDFGDDWILKVVPGESNIEETYDIRIMGEDLSADDDGDFDFNDIVLDVKFAKAGETTTQLCLRAAGGTLPLMIADNTEWETHKLFKVSESVMVNTAPGKHFEYAPVKLTLNQAIANAAQAKDITLKVFKNGKWQTLTAEIQEPAAKIAITSVAPGDWLDERVSIKDVKTQFVDWATAHRSRSTWWNE
jgi:hypothetical protein